MSIERVRRSNQSNAIERDRTVEIRLSNAIESQSNGQILGNYLIGSIEIRLRSISEPVQGREKENAMGGNFTPRKLFRAREARARCVSAISCP